MPIESYVRSTDCHCESRSQNIFPGIDVPINVLCTAAWAVPTANIEGQFFNYKPAMVTSFTTGKKSVNFDQFSPVPFTLIFELTEHFSPSSIGNRPSQLMVSNHVCYCQVLNSNQAIIPNQVCRQLMQKIGTSIFNFGVYFSYFQSRFISVKRAFGFPTQFLLRYREFVIQPLKMLGISYLFPIAGTNQTGNPSVEPNLFIRCWQWLNSWVIYQQRDKPTSRRLEFNCNSRWLTSFWKSSRPDYIQWFFALGKPNITISELESRFGKFSRATLTFLLKLRIFGSFPPKVSKCFLQMSQTLLQGYAANLVEKIKFFGFFPTGQQTRGLLVINSLLFFLPRSSSGRQSFVIDQTYTTDCPSQEIFLLGSWVKTVFVGAFSHASHYTRFDGKNLIGGAAFLPSLPNLLSLLGEEGVSCREFR